MPKRCLELACPRRRSVPAARRKFVIIAAAVFLFQQLALAAPPSVLPSGGNFVAGTGAISSSGNVVTINQSSLRGIIDWNKFSIGQNGLVQFNNGSGATLNRVTGGAMSSILGSLVASGSVYLINPEGVLIGPHGKVATGGDFVASTLNLSNAAFLTGGSLVFQGDSAAVVKNLGAVSSDGGSVFLIARSVENGGSLKAANGTAGLAAGQQILLKDSASDQRVFVQARGGDVTNSGNIAATEAELKAAGGNIYALAGNNGGQIRATGTALKNGHVWLISDGGKTAVSTTISAKNVNGTGGAIETSGQSVSTDGAHLQTGQGGTWLLDPDDLTIDSGLATTIQTSLGGGTDVTEQTSAPTSGGNGDINVASNIAWSTGSSLTLSAYRNVTVNSGVTVSNTGAGSLTLRADNTAAGTGAVAINGGVNFAGSTGNVSIFYDPVGANKYTSPVTYSGSQVQVNGGVSNQLTAYMLVNNAADLQSVGTTGAYALGANIDAGAISNFVPIAHTSIFDHPGDGFSGLFDGQGHTISNLKVNDLTDSSIGLFSQISSTGAVRNIGLTNATVAGGTDNAGGLAGENWGSISNAYTTGSVQSGNPNALTGGLAGSNDGRISNSYSTSAVTGASYVGGLVGWNSLDSTTATIANSYSTGAVSGTGGAVVGGFAGENDNVITSSYWDTQASGQGTGVGDVSIAVTTQVTGQTTAQLQSGTLPTGFSSANWIVAPGHYPALAWQGLLVSGTAYNGVSPLSSATVSGLANGVNIGSTTTNSSGKYSFSLYPGTGTNLLTYLTSGGTGNTFSDGGGTGAYSGMDIHTGSLRLISGTKTTYSGMISALGTALGANTGSNFLFTVNAGLLSTNSGTNISVFNSASSFTVDQSINATGSLFASASGNLTLGAGKTLAATGAGDALVLTTGGKFTNSAGSGALSISSGGGRWLVYSQNPANDAIGGLSYSFKQYNGVYGSTAIGQATGNGLLYTYAPVLSVSLVGAASKVYDGSATATLSAGNYNVAGAIGGDTVALNNPTSGSYSNKNAGTGKAVSVSGLSVASATSGSVNIYGYQLSSSSVSGNIGTITAKQLTAAITANNKTYDGTTAATGSIGTLAGVVGSDSVSFAGSAAYTFADKNVGTGKTITESGLSLAGADAGNYSLSVSTDTADIAAKQLTAGVTASNKAYDGTTTATASIGTLTGVAGSDDVSFSGIAAYTFADKNVGTGKAVAESGLSLTGADAGNYTLAALTGSADITAKQLTATVTANNKVYDGTTAATGSTGALAGVVGSDDVSFTGSAAYAFANKNAGAGKTVTESGLSLTGTDVANYTLAPLTGTADISARQLTAAITADNKTYNGTTAATGSIGALAGVLGSDSVSYTGTASYAFADKNVGTGKTVTESGLSLAGTDAGNYSLSVSTAIADITVKQLTAIITANNKTYDGTTTATASAGTLTGVAGSDDVSFSGSAAYAFADKNTGTGKTVMESGLSLTGADAGNYTLAALTGIADIAAKQLTAAVTANNKAYDGTATATGSTGALTGVVGSDDVSFTGSAAYAFADKNAGAGKTVTESGLGLTGADVGNYTLGALAGTADISAKQLTAAVTANNKVYDGTTTATGNTGALTGVIGGDSVTFTGTASYAFADKNAGNGKTVSESGLTLAGTDAGNYLLDVQNGTANITPAPLTASLTASNRVYDGTTTAAGSLGALVGVIGGDSVTFGGTPTYSFLDKNVGNGKTVTESGSVLAGADAGNYTLSVQNGAANITPATLMTSIAASNKVYDGTTDAMASLSTLSGVAGSDDVTLGGTASYSFTDKNVGNSKAVNESGAVLTGTDAGNYLLNVQPGTADITPATVTAGITANNKVYDGTTVATASLGALGGVIGSDAVAVAGTASYNFADKNAGNGKTVTASGLSLSGTDAGNYLLNVQNGAADITPATLTASLTANDKVYDATTGATATLSAVTGVIGSDAVTLAGTAGYNFADKNVGNGKTVTESGLSLAGTDAGNYTLDVQNGTANITPAALTASVLATNKVYDGTVDATGNPGTLNGILGTDDVTIGGPAIYSFVDKNVGNGKTVTESGLVLGGADAGNYSLTVQDGAANITPATLTVATLANNKVYDGTTAASASIGSLQGVVGGDNVTLGGTASYSFADKNAGAGKAVNTSGLAISGSDAGNYLLNVQNGTADITPVTLTATVVADNKVYDGLTAASGSVGPLSGVIGSDNIALGGTAGFNFTDKNVGSGKTVSESGLSLTGTDAGNYLLNVQNGTADITPATLSLISNPTTRTYGLANPAFTGSVTGFVNGETLASATTGTLVFTSPATGASAVGRYSIDGSGLVANDGNYVFAQAANNAVALTVAPPSSIPTITIPVTINNAARLANQPNPQFSLSYTGSPVPGLDIDSLLAQLSFQTSATTASKPGSYQIAASGQIPGYLFDVQPGTLTVIDNSPRTIPTQAIVQPGAPPVVSPPQEDGIYRSSLKTASPVGPNALGKFEMSYSVRWLKLLEDSLSQSRPIAESSFISSGSNGKAVKSYARGTAQ